VPLSDFRSVFLPYCLMKQKDGRYAVLNREYKPVGFWTREHVEYADHPVLVQMRITPKQASKLSYKGSDDVDAIYLYNDGCIPTSSQTAMTAYLERLDRLMRYKIKGTAPSTESPRSTRTSSGET
jgi:hypothetical protein